MKKLRILFRTIKEIIRLLPPRRRVSFALLALGAIITGVLEMLSISMLIPYATLLFSPESLKEAGIGDYFFSLANDNAEILVLSIGLMVIFVFLLKNLFIIFIKYKQNDFSARVQEELSASLMKRFIHNGFLFFSNSKTHELLRGIGGDINGVIIVLDNLVSLCINGMTIICLVGLIAYKNIILASIILLCSVVVILAYSFGTRRAVKEYGDKFQYYNGLIGKYSLEAFSGIKEVLVWGCETYFIKNYERAYRKCNEANVKGIMISEISRRMIEIFVVIGLVIILVMSMAKGNTSETITSLTVIVMSFMRILPTVSASVSNINAIFFKRAAVRTVLNLYGDSSPSDYINMYENEHKNQNEHINVMRSLKVKNVSWKYPGTEKWILKNADIEIEKGQCVAFIGESGAGKTTLADMFLGLFKPLEGTIEVDGESIFDNDKWLEQIGYVSQTLFLTEDSIRQNVAFGVDDKCIDDERVWDALKKAQLYEYVKGLNDGIYTWVGEGGVKLSGGQRQRIAIARVLYRNPEFIVFDEATSALDADTEKAIMDSIMTLKDHKTMVIIAHRLSTIEKCDMVYVVKDGQILVRE